MYIKVRVMAGARREEFKKIKEDTYHISVEEEARNNMANRRVAAILSEKLGLAPGKIKLVSGHHSPSKIFDLRI